MGGARDTVLVVEDDAALRMLCRVNLEMDGFRVVEAARLSEAEERLASADVDVVLMDVHLGAGETTVDLIERLAVERPELPVLLLSGSSGIVDLPPGREVLAKPFAIRDLSESVRRLADQAKGLV